MSVFTVDKLITEARRLALEYRQETGKTLPITAEIAINDAIRLLELKAAPPGSRGYDASMELDGETVKVQIKGRAIFKENKSGHRLGQLKMEQDWDGILLLIMDDQFETDEIYYCYRHEIEEALESSSTNKRGSLTVAKFKVIGRLVWSAINGREDDGFWSNRE